MERGEVLTKVKPALAASFVLEKLGSLMGDQQTKGQNTADTADTRVSWEPEVQGWSSPLVPLQPRGQVACQLRDGREERKNRKMQVSRQRQGLCGG